jgi:ABC-type branched-subunit amino acid transport system substrate-binding protein
MFKLKHLLSNTLLWVLISSAINAEEPIVKIGALFPLTGSAAEFGESLQNAALLAVKQLNQAGYRVELLTADTQTDPQTSVQIASKLIFDDKVQALIGGYSSAVTIEIAEKVAIPHQIPQIAYGSTSPFITDLPADRGQDFLFRTNTSGALESFVLAKIIYEQEYHGRLSMLYRDDAFGRGLSQYFSKYYQHLGGQVTAAVPHVEQDSYQEELKQAAKGGTSVLVSISFSDALTVYLLEAYQKKLFDNLFFLTTQPQVVEARIGVQALEGCCGTASNLIVTDSRLKFQFDYLAEYNKKPAQFSTNSYDAIVVTVLAAYAAYAAGKEITPINIRDHLREVTIPPGKSINTGIEAFEQALTRLTAGEKINYRGASGSLNFDENGDVSAAVEVWCYRENKLVTQAINIPAPSEVIGSAGRFFSADINSLTDQDSALGNLIADVMLSTAQKTHNAVAAFSYVGELKADIEKGKITYNDLINVLPSGSRLIVLEITGQGLLTILDYALSQKKKDSPSVYPYLAGMQINYCSEPCPQALQPDGVITQLTIADTAIDLEKKYRIATSSYVIGGGLLKIICERGDYCENTQQLLVELLANEFKIHSPVTSNKDERIKRE